jgi:hypothetical protein
MTYQLSSRMRRSSIVLILVASRNEEVVVRRPVEVRVCSTIGPDRGGGERKGGKTNEALCRDVNTKGGG